MICELPPPALKVAPPVPPMLPLGDPLPSWKSGSCGRGFMLQPAARHSATPEAHSAQTACGWRAIAPVIARIGPSQGGHTPVRIALIWHNVAQTRDRTVLVGVGSGAVDCTCITG